MAAVIKRDHEGVPTCKVVFWGPTMAGKTTALTIFKVLKSLEDPENVYKFLKLEDPTGRTLFFDQAIFGVGKDPRTGLPYLKYHIFTVPGQDRHVGQRKVVLQGAQGLVVVIDSEKSRWEENRNSLIEITKLAGDRLSSGQLPFYIVVNKMDLPNEDRITTFDVGKLLVEAGANTALRDAAARIYEVSCLQARDDLRQLLSSRAKSEIMDESGRLKRDLRPLSVQRVIKPVESLVREILVAMMRARAASS